VVVSEEKGWLSDAWNWTKQQVKKLNDVSFSLPSVSYTPKHLSVEIPVGKANGDKWSANAKFFGELDITFTGSVDGEFTFVPLEMKKFGLKIGADATAKGGFKAGIKREDTKKIQNTKIGKDIVNKYKEFDEWYSKDICLGKVPLVSAAGLVSVNYGTIQNCINYANISALGCGPRFGGIVGYNYNGTVTNCYTLSTAISTTIGNDKGTATNTTSKTMAQMQVSDFVTLLGGTTRWQLVTNNYPKLYWE